MSSMPFARILFPMQIFGFVLGFALILLIRPLNENLSNVSVSSLVGAEISLDCQPDIAELWTWQSKAATGRVDKF